MNPSELRDHIVNKWVEPFTILELPSTGRNQTLHGETRLLSSKYSNRPIVVLTELGRNILCAHISGSLPPTSLSPDLVAALAVNTQVNPPTSLNSWSFHFLNVLWNLRGIALRRSDLNFIKVALADSFKNHPHPEWFPKRSEDDDIIQHVNKTGQWGLSKKSEALKAPNGDSVTYYWLDLPLTFELPRIQSPQNFTTQIPNCNCQPESGHTPESSDRDLSLERLRVIQFLNDNFINVPLSDWTSEGHKDAQNKELGTVAQPKRFNRTARDKWKFDNNGLIICPSVGNLTSNLRKFYPSDDELKKLLAELTKELGSTTPSE
jgi:hypothetical protein